MQQQLETVIFSTQNTCNMGVKLHKVVWSLQFWHLLKTLLYILHLKKRNRPHTWMHTHMILKYSNVQNSYPVPPDVSHFSQRPHCVCQSFSHVRLLVTPWTLACKASLAIGLFRQEYWSGQPVPFPGDLPNIGIKPRSPTLQQILCHCIRQNEK